MPGYPVYWAQIENQGMMLPLFDCTGPSMSGKLFAKTLLLALYLVALVVPAKADILEVINQSDSAALAKMIENGFDANAGAGENKGTLPLVYAAAIGRHEIVSQLIAAGADVEAAQLNGRTPLMATASGGSVEVLNLLRSHGLVPAAEHIKIALERADPTMVTLLEHATEHPEAGAYDLKDLSFEPVPTETLIKAMQVRLILLGYYKGDVNGLLNQETTAALTTFNRQAGVAIEAKITGETLAALGPATRPDCANGPIILTTNAYWSYHDLINQGCIAADAGLNEFQAIERSTGGLTNPYTISCEGGGQLAMTPETWAMIPIWSNYEGKFMLANLQIDGCATIGDRGYLIGAGSTVTFQPIER